MDALGLGLGLKSDNKLDGWLDETAARSSCKRLCHNLAKSDSFMTEVLDKVSGWNSHLTGCVQRENDKLHSTRGFFLTGQAGNGKHTAAHAVAEYLASEDGWFASYGDDTDEKNGAFDVLFVENSDFTVPNISPAEYIDYILDCYLCDDENNSGLCLIIDRPEKIPEYEEFLLKLGYLIISYRCRPETNTLVFFIISDTLDENALPHLLRNQVQVCNILPPNEKRREEFWRLAERESADVKELLSLNGRSPADMAALTSGMSYRELYDTVMLSCRAGKTDNIDIAEGNLEFEIQRHSPENEDTRDILYKKLEAFIDKLPDLSERFTEAVESISVSSVSVGNAVSSAEATTPEKNENMNVLDKLGESKKYLRDGIDEGSLQNGSSLDVFDRDKFEADFEKGMCKDVFKIFEK